MHPHLRTLLTLAATCSLTLTACVEDPDAGDELGTSEEAIQGGTLAGPFARARAGMVGKITTQFVPKCTVTRISPRHVITALHCQVLLNDDVIFYSDGPDLDLSLRRKVVDVTLPPGTSVTSSSNDWTDANNLFADLAVVTLDAPLPGTVANLAFGYPGDDAPGLKVGAGGHEGNPALVGILMQKPDTTFSGDDTGGGFRTTECATDLGDSGGAFYVDNKLLGVTNGCTTLGDVYWRGRYTSAARHLDFILDAMDYRWPGTTQPSRLRQGNTLNAMLSTTLARCEYMCDRTSNCVAFNHASSGMCILLSSVTSSAVVNGWLSGAK